MKTETIDCPIHGSAPAESVDPHDPRCEATRENGFCCRCHERQGPLRQRCAHCWAEQNFTDDRIDLQPLLAAVEARLKRMPAIPRPEDGGQGP